MIDYGLGIYLAPIDQDFIYAMRDWRNDYRIRKWTRQNDLLSHLDQDDWYEKQHQDPKIRMYTVVDLSKKVLGVCGLTGIDLVNRNAEFSLYIVPAFHRKGHGKKALKTLISHGFNTYGLEVIWGESFVNNPATKMYEGIGFSLDGVRRNFYYRDGRFVNAHLFSILRSEWECSDAFQGCRTHACSS